MFRRLFWGILALLLATFAAAALLSVDATRRRMRGQIESRLEAQALLLRALVQSEKNEADLQSRLTELGRGLGARLTVIGPDGAPVADSAAVPAAMENLNSRPEIQQARAEGRGRHVRRSDAVQGDMMYWAVPLDPSKPQGSVVRAAAVLKPVGQELGGLLWGLALGFALAALAGAGLSYALSRRMSRPLEEIRKVAEGIASGDLSLRAPLDWSDEAGEVATSINRMSEQLSGRLATLRGESAKLEAIISSMVEGVIGIDEQGTIQHCNAAGKTLFDVRVDPLGLKVWEVIRLPGLEEKVAGVLRERSSLNTSLSLGPKTVALFICPVAQGGAILVGRDATEERRYDALRREFVANVSHELRTPLSLIQGYVDTLKDGAVKDEAKAAEFLETIDRHAKRLGAIVDDLLQISKLESSDPWFQRRTVEVGSLLDRIEENFRPLAAKRSQTLAVQYGPERIDADPDLLERAVGNLVDNAIKYTPEGGKIEVRAGMENGSLVIAVRDTGIGIPESDLPRVFERFYRVDKSRSRELGGTGLGLAIVKHIAQLHGGAVTVESQVGRGSTFTLRIPAEAPPHRAGI
jgi:two-component system phosphate regulon sensor histidine kinase PhoR